MPNLADYLLLDPNVVPSGTNTAASTTFNLPRWSVMAKTPGGRQQNSFARLATGVTSGGDVSLHFLVVSSNDRDSLQVEVFDNAGAKILDYGAGIMRLKDAETLLEIRFDKTTLSAAYFEFDVSGQTFTSPTFDATNMRETAQVNLGHNENSGGKWRGRIYWMEIEGWMTPPQRKAERTRLAKRNLLEINKGWNPDSEHGTSGTARDDADHALAGLAQFDANGDPLPGQGGLNTAKRYSEDLIINSPGTENGAYRAQRTLSGEMVRLYTVLIGSGGSPLIPDKNLEIMKYASRFYEGPGCLPLTADEIGPDNVGWDPYKPRNYGNFRANAGWDPVPNYLAEFTDAEPIRRQLLEGTAPNGNIQNANEVGAADRQENSIGFANSAAMAALGAATYDQFADDDSRTDHEKDLAKESRLEWAHWHYVSAKDLFGTWESYTAATSPTTYGRSDRVMPQAIDTHFTWTDMAGLVGVAVYETLVYGGDITQNTYYQRAQLIWDNFWGNPRAGRDTIVSATETFETIVDYDPTVPNAPDESIYNAGETGNRRRATLPRMQKFGSHDRVEINGKWHVFLNQIDPDTIEDSDGTISDTRPLVAYGQNYHYGPQTFGWSLILYMLGFDRITKQHIEELYNAVNAGYFNQTRIDNNEIASTVTDFDTVADTTWESLDPRAQMTSFQGKNGYGPLSVYGHNGLTIFAGMVEDDRLINIAQQAYTDDGSPASSHYPMQMSLRRKAVTAANVEAAPITDVMAGIGGRVPKVYVVIDGAESTVTGVGAELTAHAKGTGNLTYAWTSGAMSFDDSTAKTVQASSNAVGSYFVTVTVTDENGDTDSDTFQVSVTAAFSALRRPSYNPLLTEQTALIGEGDNEGRHLPGHVLALHSLFANPKYPYAYLHSTDHTQSVQGRNFYAYMKYPDGPIVEIEELDTGPVGSYPGDQLETPIVEATHTSAPYSAVLYAHADAAADGDDQRTLKFRPRDGDDTGTKWDYVGFAFDWSTATITDVDHDGYATPSAIETDGNSSTGVYYYKLSTGKLDNVDPDRLRPVWRSENNYSGWTFFADRQKEALPSPLNAGDGVSKNYAFVRNGETCYFSIEGVGSSGDSAGVDGKLGIYQFNESKTAFERIATNIFTPQAGTWEEGSGVVDPEPVGVLQEGGKTYFYAYQEHKRMGVFVMDDTELGAHVGMATPGGEVYESALDAVIEVAEGTSAIASVEFSLDGGAFQAATDNGNGTWSIPQQTLVEGTPLEITPRATDANGIIREGVPNTYTYTTDIVSSAIYDSGYLHANNGNALDGSTARVLQPNDPQFPGAWTMVMLINAATPGADVSFYNESFAGPSTTEPHNSFFIVQGKSTGDLRLSGRDKPRSNANTFLDTNLTGLLNSQDHVITMVKQSNGSFSIEADETGTPVTGTSTEDFNFNAQTVGAKNSKEEGLTQIATATTLRILIFGSALSASQLSSVVSGVKSGSPTAPVS